jgi:hypothetical protein
MRESHEAALLFLVGEWKGIVMLAAQKNVWRGLFEQFQRL